MPTISAERGKPSSRRCRAAPSRSPRRSRPRRGRRAAVPNDVADPLELLALDAGGAAKARRTRWLSATQHDEPRSARQPEPRASSAGHADAGRGARAGCPCRRARPSRSCSGPQSVPSTASAISAGAGPQDGPPARRRQPAGREQQRQQETDEAEPQEAEGLVEPTIGRTRGRDRDRRRTRGRSPSSMTDTVTSSARPSRIGPIGFSGRRIDSSAPTPASTPSAGETSASSEPLPNAWLQHARRDRQARPRGRRAGHARRLTLIASDSLRTGGTAARAAASSLAVWESLRRLRSRRGALDELRGGAQHL